MSIAAIQIKRKELGLSDERYRAILREVAGVDSSRFLNPKAQTAVYKRLCAMSRADSKAARYVWVLWEQLQPFLTPKEKNGAYLAGFIRRSTATGLSDLSELSLLSAGDLHKVIESLKKRLNQEKEKMADVPF